MGFRIIYVLDHPYWLGKHLEALNSEDLKYLFHVQRPTGSNIKESFAKTSRSPSFSK